MSKKKKKRGLNNLPSSIELANSIRRDWNGVNPVSRIVESKKNKPVKHKIKRCGRSAYKQDGICRKTYSQALWHRYRMPGGAQPVQEQRQGYEDAQNKAS